jgi:hypothetical protein
MVYSSLEFTAILRLRLNMQGLVEKIMLSSLFSIVEE